MAGAEIIERVAEMLGGAKCGVFGCGWTILHKEGSDVLYKYKCGHCGAEDPEGDGNWLRSNTPFPAQD